MIKTYSFDLTKADKIFDMLLKAKQIKLNGRHKIPTHEELRTKDYCKWHNSFTHSTNKCVLFRNVIQERMNKLLQFLNEIEAMEVDTNAFLKLVDVDMITINWKSKGEQVDIKKVNKNTKLTDITPFVGLQSRSPVVRKAPSMANLGKAPLEYSNAMTLGAIGQQQ